MMRWSRAHTLIAGAALIVLTNAVALVGMAYNRSGDPDSVLTLTQRELQMSYRWWRERENSGIALRLLWRVDKEEIGDEIDTGTWYAGVGGAPTWLTKPKLAELGFDVSQPENSDRGRMHYEKQLPREVLLVLELDGPAYAEARERAKRYADREDALRAANPDKKEFERRSKEARDRVDREEHQYSRLFAVDAGVDAGALRSKHPDRTHYAVARAQVHPMVTGSERSLKLSGYISALSIDEINVPLQFRNVFEHALPDPATGARNAERFDATVAFGKRLEPWITAAAQSGSN
jgi:Domain of unknown function (DUF4824)